MIMGAIGTSSFWRLASPHQTSLSASQWRPDCNEAVHHLVVTLAWYTQIRYILTLCDEEFLATAPSLIDDVNPFKIVALRSNDRCEARMTVRAARRSGEVLQLLHKIFYFCSK